MIILNLFLTFFKIGAFTFGGGYAMIPLISESVLKYGWTTEKELVNFIAVSESTPGPFAVNMATYVGSTAGGFFGAVAATLGVILPSFLIILLIAKIYLKFKENKYVSGIMYGIRPAVVGLIGSAVISIGKTVFFPKGFSPDFLSAELIISVIIFAFMFFLRMKKKNPILIIVISAAAGILAGYVFLH